MSNLSIILRVFVATTLSFLLNDYATYCIALFSLYKIIFKKS